MNFILFLAVLTACFSSLPLSLCDDQPLTQLQNKAIHTFQNRHDSGFLTAINVRTPTAAIVTDIWRDASTQKWRDVSALLSYAYQLRPVSNEDRQMDYDPYTGHVYQDDVGLLNLGNTPYWHFVYVGQGYHVIRNYKDGRCLESSGLGQPVAVVECNSIPRQQWQVVRL